VRGRRNHDGSVTREEIGGKEQQRERESIIEEVEQKNRGLISGIDEKRG
jgi:hypothetical protein